jgi:hypothetical protein
VTHVDLVGLGSAASAASAQAGAAPRDPHSVHDYAAALAVHSLAARLRGAT